MKGRFHRHNLAEVAGRAVLPCRRVCQSIPQLRMYGTESHSRRTQEKGSQRPRAALRREIHAAHEIPEARGGAQEHYGEAAEAVSMWLRLSS